MFRLVKIVLLTFGVIIVATSGAVYSARQGNVYRCLLSRRDSWSDEQWIFDTVTGSTVRDGRNKATPSNIDITSGPNGMYWIADEESVAARGTHIIYLGRNTGTEIQLAIVKGDDIRSMRMSLDSSWIALSTVEESKGTNPIRTNVIRVFNLNGAVERTLTLPEELYPNEVFLKANTLQNSKQFVYQTDEAYFIVNLPDLTMYRFPRLGRWATRWTVAENNNLVAMVQSSPNSVYFWLTLYWLKENRVISIPLPPVDLTPFHLAWSPDSRRLLLAYETPITQNSLLMVDTEILLEGSTPSVWMINTPAFFNPRQQTPIWAADSQSVFYFRASQTGRHSGYMLLRDILNPPYEYEMVRYWPDTGLSTVMLHHIAMVEQPISYAPTFYAIYTLAHNGTWGLTLFNRTNLFSFDTTANAVFAHGFRFEYDLFSDSDWVAVRWMDEDVQRINLISALVNWKTLQTVTGLEKVQFTDRSDLPYGLRYANFHWATDQKSVFYVVKPPKAQSLVRFDTVSSEIQHLLDNKTKIVVTQTANKLFALWEDEDGKRVLEQFGLDGRSLGAYSTTSPADDLIKFALSPDEKHLILFPPDDRVLWNAEYELIPLDGKPSIMRPRTKPTWNNIVWSPDSEHFSFIQSNDVSSKLRVFSVDGALLQQWDYHYGNMPQWTRCD